MSKQNLELIHEKFKYERCCKHCHGYFLSPKNPDAEYCPRCIRDGRDKPNDDLPDNLVHQDVNVSELKKEVMELKKIISDLTKDKTDGVTEETVSKYKDRDCSKCGKTFIPGSPAQKICHECRAEFIN